MIDIITLCILWKHCQMSQLGTRETQGEPQILNVVFSRSERNVNKWGYASMHQIVIPFWIFKHCFTWNIGKWYHNSCYNRKKTSNFNVLFFEGGLTRWKISAIIMYYNITVKMLTLNMMIINILNVYILNKTPSMLNLRTIIE